MGFSGKTDAGPARQGPACDPPLCANLGLDLEDAAALDWLDEEVPDGGAVKSSAAIAYQAGHRNGSILKPFEGVQHSQHARSAQLEDGSEKEPSRTGLGSPVNIPVRILNQSAVRPGPVDAPGKAIQTLEASGLGDLEHGSIAGETPRDRAAKEITRAVQEQPALGPAAIFPARKGVQDGKVSVAGKLKDRTLIFSATLGRDAIEISSGVPHQRPLWIGAVRFSVEVVKYGQRSAGVNLVQGAKSTTPEQRDSVEVADFIPDHTPGGYGSIAPSPARERVQGFLIAVLVDSEQHAGAGTAQGGAIEVASSVQKQAGRWEYSIPAGVAKGVQDALKAVLVHLENSPAAIPPAGSGAIEIPVRVANDGRLGKRTVRNSGEYMQ